MWYILKILYIFSHLIILITILITMKHISTTLFLLLFALPVFSQFELNVGFEADFKFNDKTENLVPNSGMLFYGFNAAIGYGITPTFRMGRSEEHTSELQSRPHLVCRLLLEKK